MLQNLFPLTFDFTVPDSFEVRWKAWIVLLLENPVFLKQKMHRGYTKPDRATVTDELCAQLSQKAQDHYLHAFTVPAKQGKAWELQKGQVCRFTLQGPQVGDLNLWNLHNFKEHFYSGKTRQIQRGHLTTGDRLWSNMPYLRPMATITSDSLKGYTPDSDGMGVHDVLGTRCDPYIHREIYGTNTTVSCHQILTKAVAAYALEESDIHDVFNIFMCTGFDSKTHEYLIKGTPAKKGDFIEIYAEIDLLVALSVCPCGDVSEPAGKDGQAVCYPIDVFIGDAN